MIIMEGPDASGKTTLAHYMAHRLNQSVWLGSPMIVKSSEGPIRSSQELEERIARYASAENTLFDRHPCVSQPIYGVYQEEVISVEPRTLEQFYAGNHVFIYCDSSLKRFREHHEVKQRDTPRHLQMLAAHYEDILICYRIWASNHAHIIYRIGDDMNRILQWVKSSLDYL